MPPPLTEAEGAEAVNAALVALDVVKPGEHIKILHAHSCAGRVREGDAPCTCPGGPELIYADWDEVQPRRHYHIPERFYVGH